MIPGPNRFSDIALIIYDITSKKWEKIEGEDRRERESEKRWRREKEEGDVW